MSNPAYERPWRLKVTLDGYPAPECDAQTNDHAQATDWRSYRSDTFIAFWKASQHASAPLLDRMQGLWWPMAAGATAQGRTG
jgi:hypothetical protein